MHQTKKHLGKERRGVQGTLCWGSFAEIQHVREDVCVVSDLMILSRHHTPFNRFDMQSRPGASSTAQVLVKPFLETETFE
ncbi:hypothetical protein MPLSOD_41093 [Mesorhizobium sp. SOD10]|nr:hypothetical protein MPLSOD_41093 [Mesorhizobium sp. SOD10]